MACRKTVVCHATGQRHRCVREPRHSGDCWCEHSTPEKRAHSRRFWGAVTRAANQEPMCRATGKGGCRGGCTCREAPGHRGKHLCVNCQARWR